MDTDSYGPPLPPGFKRESGDELSNEAPPCNVDSAQDIIIGPQCPPDFLSNKCSDNDKTSVIGPELPLGFVSNESDDSESGNEEIYGPIPIMTSNNNDNIDDVVADLEKRAKSMKRKLDGHDIPLKKIEREEWMTTPNTSSRNQLGAISRCLSNDKDHKNKARKKDEKYRTSKEDEKLSKALEKYNKCKRKESLLEMHEKKREKKKKEKSKPSERKPFSRDDDMSLRLMNKDQVKSVIDKAKFLDSRFSKGQSKYL